MTKSEKEIFAQIFGLISSATSQLEYDMQDFDCSWPKSIVKQLKEAKDLCIKIRK